MPTATPGSAISTRWPAPTSRPAGRWSAWTPRNETRRGLQEQRAGVAAQGNPERAKVHDFPDPTVGKAIPGVYDVAANTGWVSVGRDHDTSAFAVSTLRRWWASVGHIAYPTADRLLICADGGGSNGYRVLAWKTELAALARETVDLSLIHI